GIGPLEQSPRQSGSAWAHYEDGNDANSLRADPMFKMAHDLAPRRTVFAVDHFAAGEDTGYPHPAAHGTCHGRLVLRLVQAGSQTHRAGYRRPFDAVHGGHNAHYDEYV